MAKANQVWEAIRKFPLNFIEANIELTLAAAKIKATYTLTFAGAFAAAIPIQKKQCWSRETRSLKTWKVKQTLK